MSNKQNPENQRLTSPRYRRAAERLHNLGPRVLGELLIEIGVDLPEIEYFARIDRLPPELLEAVGAGRWPVQIFALGGD